jgi:hypothetical protein
MKKFLFVLAVVFGLSATAMAQQKGDKFIVGAISATTVNAATFNLGVAIEGGGFVADRWALSGTASYGLLNRDDHMLVVAPQVAYYVRLADKFYYTPSLTVGGIFTSTDGYNTGGLASKIAPFAVEFRPTKHFGLGVNMFSFTYYLIEGQSVFSLNLLSDVSVSFRYYF